MQGGGEFFFSLEVGQVGGLRLEVSLRVIDSVECRAFARNEANRRLITSNAKHFDGVNLGVEYCYQLGVYSEKRSLFFNNSGFRRQSHTIKILHAWFSYK